MARLVSLDETPVQDLQLEDPHHLNCEIPPGKIVSIEVALNR
jgi:hypothetical protein